MVIFHSYVSLPEGRAFKWFKYTEIYGKNGNLTRNHWELALFFYGCFTENGSYFKFGNLMKTMMALKLTMGFGALYLIFSDECICKQGLFHGFSIQQFLSPGQIIQIQIFQGAYYHFVIQ